MEEDYIIKVRISYGNETRYEYMSVGDYQNASLDEFVIVAIFKKLDKLNEKK
jgi:hypothetical protein